MKLSESELQRYSVSRAIAAAAAAAELPGRSNVTGFEMDVHRALAESMPADAPPELFAHNTIFVPREAMQRAMTLSSGSGGGFLQTDTNGAMAAVQAALAGGARRPYLRLRDLGAREVNGMRFNGLLPRIGTGVTTGWLSSDTAAAADGDSVLGQGSVSPKIVASKIDIGRNLLQVSGPLVDQIILPDMAMAVDQAADQAALIGTGGAQPLGILNNPATPTFSGTSLAWAGVRTAARSLITNASVRDYNTLAWLGSGLVADTLMGRQRFTGTDSPLWEGSLVEGRIAGHRAVATNYLPASQLLFGDFSQLVRVNWGPDAMAIAVDPFGPAGGTNFNRGVVTVRIYTMTDWYCAQPSAFIAASAVT